MPVARHDVLAVLTLQDRVLAARCDGAHLVIGRNLLLPEMMRGRYKAPGAVRAAAVKEAQTVIGASDSLVKRGLGKAERTRCSETLGRIDALER